MKKINRIVVLILLCCTMFSMLSESTVYAMAQSGTTSSQAYATTKANGKSSNQILLGIGEVKNIPLKNKKVKVTYKIGNKKIVSIVNGKVRGIKSGETFISARVGKKTYKYKVKVSKDGICDLSKSLIVTQSQVLKINNIKGKVKWSSANKKIAIVNNKGKVTAKGKGRTTIKATVARRTFTCIVNVKEAGFANNKEVIGIKADKKLKLLGVAKNTKITWKTTNKKVVKVDSNGKITGLKAGKAVISAQCNGKSYKCTIQVKKPYLEKSKISIDEKAHSKIKLNLAKAKSYMSSNNKIARVNSKGVITGVKEGRCTITVTDTFKRKYKCVVTVNSIRDTSSAEESPYLSATDIYMIAGDSQALALKGTSKSVTWSSSNSAVAVVSTDGIVTGCSVGTAVITATCNNNSYNCNVTVTAAGSEYTIYTRSQWIGELIKSIGIDVSQIDDDFIHYYADTAEDTNAKAIEYARQNGIVPATEDEQDVPVFNPNDIATREFAAMTAINALGYKCDDTVSVGVSDESSITYKGAVSIAIKLGMLTTSNGAFSPAGNLNGVDAARILAKIAQVNASENSTAEHCRIVYKNNVIVNRLAKYKDYSVTDLGNSTYRVEINNDKEISYLKKGNIAVMPISRNFQNGIAIKISKNAVCKSNKVVFEGTLVSDITQIMSDVSFAGQGQVVADAVTTVEGVSYTYSPSTTGTLKSNFDSKYTSMNQVSVPLGKFSFDLHEGIDLGNGGKITGTFAVDFPELRAEIDGNVITGFDNILLKLTSGLSLTEKLEYSVANATDSGSKEFARIPVEVVPGISVDVVLKIYYEASGSLSVGYTLETEEGIQYKDGEFRFIGNLKKNNLDITKLEGAASVGLKTDLNLVLGGVFDVVGIDGKIGPRVTASATVHPNDLVCMDGAVYLSIKLELNQETILGEILKSSKHYTLSKEVMDVKNSPLKKTIHFENGVKVEKCTYGNGNLSGKVYDASNNKVIKNARVEVYQDNLLKDKGYSDSNGQYKLSNLATGTYTLRISATGYKTYTDTINVLSNSTVEANASMLVDRNNSGNGKIKGSVDDAVNAESVTATYTVRNNWNNTTGADIVTTGTANGEYELELAAGNYTISFSADNYVAGYINVVVVSDETNIKDISLSPSSINGEGRIRIVLTWGEKPRDLDSHLLGPDAGGSDTRFHTYYNEKNYNYDDHLYANLDRDDISSYGPETTTVYTLAPSGTYSFYVHDFTNRNVNDSEEMANSFAKVALYIDNQLYSVYNVPTNVKGNLWHVFDIDAATLNVTYSGEYYTGKYSMLRKSDKQQNTDKKLILDSIVDKE